MWLTIEQVGVWFLILLPTLIALYLAWDIHRIRTLHRAEVAEVKKEREMILERLLMAKIAGADVPPPPDEPVVEETLPHALVEIIADFESAEGQRRAEQRIREMRSQGLSEQLIAKRFEMGVAE